MNSVILNYPDYGLSWIMQRTQCTNTYQFHFFVLPMIFMPNPTVLYLCSQLASVTKGLCKQLLQANRFLLQRRTVSYAAPIYPPGMHGNMSPPFFFFFRTCFKTVLQREMEKKARKQETSKSMHQTKRPLGVWTLLVLDFQQIM